MGVLVERLEAAWHPFVHIQGFCCLIPLYSPDVGNVCAGVEEEVLDF